MERKGWKHTAAYGGLLAAAFGVAVGGSWALAPLSTTPAYDFMFRITGPTRGRPIGPAVHRRDTLAATPAASTGSVSLGGSSRVVAGLLPKAVAVDVFWPIQDRIRRWIEPSPRRFVPLRIWCSLGVDP